MDGPFGYSETVFHLFRMGLTQGQQIPTAAISLQAEFEHELDSDDYIFHADPIYLRPDQDRLLAFDFYHQPLTEEETKIFADAFNEYFLKDELSLITPNNLRWYLRSKKKSDVKTFPLSEILGRNIDLFLPEGKDGLKWRSFINEIQMLFYGLPINETRQSFGQWPVSGLWISGGGILPKKEIVGFQDYSGDCQLASGLQSMATKKENHCLIVNRVAERAVFDASYDQWKNAILELDLIVKRLINSDLMLYFCDGRIWKWSPKMSRRFWIRRRGFNYFKK
tara:strand:- start:666 stop:1505 length:840 start_codon:yes stop_codon:yes gene_type:complete